MTNWPKNDREWARTDVGESQFVESPPLVPFDPRFMDGVPPPAYQYPHDDALPIALNGKGNGCADCVGECAYRKDGYCAGPLSSPTRKRLIDTDSATRKTFPMATGLLDYFPDALAAVAQISYLGNQKHNPGEPLHHVRGKSMDHPDCIMRHLTERGGYDVIMIRGVEHRMRHSAALVWRGLALLQEELECEMGLPLPRGARPA